MSLRQSKLKQPAQLKLPDPRMALLRDHARHGHDSVPRLDRAACRRFQARRSAERATRETLDRGRRIRDTTRA